MKKFIAIATMLILSLALSSCHNQSKSDKEALSVVIMALLSNKTPVCVKFPKKITSGSYPTKPMNCYVSGLTLTCSSSDSSVSMRYSYSSIFMAQKANIGMVEALSNTLEFADPAGFASSINSVPNQSTGNGNAFNYSYSNGKLVAMNSSGFQTVSQSFGGHNPQGYPTTVTSTGGGMSYIESYSYVFNGNRPSKVTVSQSASGDVNGCPSGNPCVINYNQDGWATSHTIPGGVPITLTAVYEGSIYMCDAQ